ncbi:hypothetical protein VOLCADRAFT_87948 [Volvox carteri f. nagariensis]|uniref:Uncharacterized protein n=1 Tax=Volvox carteri f. nagariensis TaxID=3068 RepID=D8TMN6_VOLCA|nr:uncharacterized protein VOLCADRAFT_87948 [Volvox carteri f. nagariensis]EFJ51157.1 hypothetical protein VOLCADRAFT_87948 [Volvox carteri f. nagariensis]|eukprot:XP_002947624.1 hypothetical protein VOLCADRAFT_87948 [Volvox carteri f. nagariensis]
MAMLKPGCCTRVVERVGARRKLGLACLPADHQQNYDHISEKSAHQSADANDFVREAGAPRMSDAFRETVKSLGAFSDITLSEFQMKLLKQVTAVLADAMMPPGAPPSLRLLVRRALRAAVLLTHTATFFIRIWAVVGAVAHSNPVPGGLATEAELASTVFLLFFSAAGVPASSLLLRALAATTALLADGRGLGAAADGLSRMDSQHLDLVASAEEA